MSKKCRATKDITGIVRRLDAIQQSENTINTIILLLGEAIRSKDLTQQTQITNQIVNLLTCQFLIQIILNGQTNNLTTAQTLLDFIVANSKVASYDQSLVANYSVVNYFDCNCQRIVDLRAVEHLVQILNPQLGSKSFLYVGLDTFRVVETEPGVFKVQTAIANFTTVPLDSGSSS
jgi:hypothetical protein